jgi:hypothetical protein
MSLQPAANDTLGLSRYTERSSSVCLGMYLAVADTMEAEGLAGEEHLGKFQRRIAAIYTGKQPCPAAATCKKFKRNKSKLQTTGNQLGLF